MLCSVDCISSYYVFLDNSFDSHFLATYASLFILFLNVLYYPLLSTSILFLSNLLLSIS